MSSFNYKDVKNFIPENEVNNTVFQCNICGKTMTVKYKKTEVGGWFSLQCKCLTAIYYASGYFNVIPKTVYLKNKEKEEDLDKNAL